MLTEELKIKFQTFLNKLQEECKKRDQSAEIKASYNSLKNDFDITIEYSGKAESYVVAQDHFGEWIWLRHYKL